MIRDFVPTDIPAIQAIHQANKLPENCLPDLSDPLFIVKSVVELDGHPVMAGFLKVTSEAYVLIDHQVGTPQQRWEWMHELTEEVKRCAWSQGLDEITVWVPDEIDKSFGKRLIELWFAPSNWKSYTCALKTGLS